MSDVRPVGRPPKEFDPESFEKLCTIQCTKLEICAFFDTTDKTLENWVQRHYGENFSEVFEKKRGYGNIALRRKQYTKALAGNTALLIFLGKNRLGQSDKMEERFENVNPTEVKITWETAPSEKKMEDFYDKK